MIGNTYLTQQNIQKTNSKMADINPILLVITLNVMDYPQ